MTMSLQYKATLEQAILEHLSEVKIDGNYKCEKCGKESKAKVSHEFVRLPKYMMFHIKRFDSIFNKIKGNMHYPPVVDMRTFTTKETDVKLLGNTKYDLFALTVHHGTINQGHYIAYVKRDGTWYQFNDEYFTMESEKTALSQQAYLLFYAQR